MIYLEEIRLHLTDAKMAYGELLSRPAEHWTDWYANYMINGGMLINQNELAALLREADTAYHAELEQYPWINYISNYVFNSTNGDIS